MYVERELFNESGSMLETLVMHKTRNLGGSTWLLGPGSFKVIGHYESQMQACPINLTNESGTSMVCVPNIATVKLEPIDDIVLVLSNSNDDVCCAIDLEDTSPNPFGVCVQLIPNPLSI